MYTGAPNISVPIYTIAGRELNVPLSFTYDATGVKVNQMATQVGLSWNLNAGGAHTTLNHDKRVPKLELLSNNSWLKELLNFKLERDINLLD